MITVRSNVYFSRVQSRGYSESEYDVQTEEKEVGPSMQPSSDEIITSALKYKVSQKS